MHDVDNRGIRYTLASAGLVASLIFLLASMAANYRYGFSLARTVTERWTSMTDMPLRFVIGKQWVAGSVAAYSADRPSVFLEGDSRLSPWVNPDELRRAGAVLIWINGNRDLEHPALTKLWLDRFPQAAMQPPIQLSWQGRVKSRRAPLEFGWAIL